MESTYSDIAADDNARFFPGVSTSHRYRAVQFQGFGEGMFRIILFCRFSHQPRIDDEEISAAIVLQKFDGAPNHVGKARLLISRFEVIAVGKLHFRKTTENFRAAPRRDGFDLGLCSSQIKALAPDLGEEVPPILANAVLFRRQEILDASAKDHVEA